MTTGEQEQQSALQENISKKGKNAYYYAHGSKINGPAWDGKEEPRLISVTTTEIVKVSKNVVKSFESFSWLDETRNVKVYVEFESATDIDDDCISLTNTHDSVEFKVTRDGKEHALVLHPLQESIESASYKKKSDKFIIVLKKSTETTWHQLKKSS